MKIYKTLAIAMAMIVGFSACSKEDNNGGNDGKESSLIVYLPSNTVLGTRGIEGPSTPVPETTLANAVVYLLNSNTVVKTEEVTPTDILAGYKVFEQVSSSVNTVVVVANLSATDLAALKSSSITTLSQIERYAFDIPGQSSPGIAGKTMIGKTSTLTPDTNPTPGDSHTYKKADVELKSITARFEFDGDISRGTGVKTVKLEAVWFNNFPMTYATVATPKCYDMSDPIWAINPSADLTGQPAAIAPSGITIPTYAPTEYHDVNDGTVDGTTLVYAYQLFAGNYVPHMVLLVSGTYDNDEHFLGFLTYNYFIDDDHLTPNTRIEEVEGNKIYKISGAVCHSKDLTEVPELDKFDLGLNCTIKDWEEKNVTPGIE